MAQGKKKSACKYQAIIQSAKKTCTMLETVLVTSLNVHYARDRPGY